MIIQKNKEMVGAARLELATLRSQSARSSHLNYAPTLSLDNPDIVPECGLKFLLLFKI